MVKPKLSYQKQIQHLIAKDITFSHYTEDQAFNYLRENNNFFKLCAYRKNFQKRDGTNNYLHLDFAYLVDACVII